MEFKNIVKNIQTIYVFGKGKVSCGVATNSLTEIPSITVSKLIEQQKITTDLLNKDIEETDVILLSFENIEGFRVFKKMVDEVERKLLEHESLKP